MPVGNASDGIGLFAGQVMISANMNMQHINWGHDPVDPEPFEHFGHLNSVLLIPTITIGLSDYWNVNYTQFIGLRAMEWGPHNETSVHHRTESSLTDYDNANGGFLGDGKLIFKYLLYNAGHEEGNRLFLGVGISAPSDNVLTSDPFFLAELEDNGGDGIDPWEDFVDDNDNGVWDDGEDFVDDNANGVWDDSDWNDGEHNHRHFALSDGNYKGLLELQYFNKRKNNPVFWGIKFNMSRPFKDSDYGYAAGDSYNLALSALFKPTKKIFTNPIGISSGVFLVNAQRGYWNGLPDPTSKSTVLIPSIGAIWEYGKGTVSLNFQKPFLISGYGAGSENALNNKFDAIEITIGYRYALDYVIPWLYF